MTDQKTIYLHIGYNKTGTSTIQNVMARNRDVFQKYGLLYPNQGRSGDGHHNLAWFFRQNEKRPFHPSKGKFEDALLELENSGLKRILLSSEYFRGIRKDNIKDIAKMLPSSFKTYIIVYLRRQDLYLQSAFIQSLKSGNWSGPADDWFDRPGPARPCDYAAALERWANVFGVENIIVRPFEQSQLVDGDLVKDFLSLLELDSVYPHLSLPENKNVSPDAKVVKIIQELAHAKSRLENDGKVTNDRHYVIMVRGIQSYAETAHWNSQKYNTITRERHDAIMHEFDESNRAVARKYLDRDDLFFDEFSEKPLTFLPDVDLDVNDVSGAFIAASYELSQHSTKQRERLQQRIQSQANKIQELQTQDERQQQKIKVLNKKIHAQTNNLHTLTEQISHLEKLIENHKQGLQNAPLLALQISAKTSIKIVAYKVINKIKRIFRLKPIHP